MRNSIKESCLWEFCQRLLCNNIQQISDFSKCFSLQHKRAAGVFRSLGLLLFIFRLDPVWASFEAYPVGARWQSMAGSGIAGSDPQGLFLHNPAFLAQQGGSQLSFSHMQLFSMRELPLYHLNFGRHWKTGGAGAALQRLGSELYSETCFAAAVAFRIDSVLDLGVTVRYARVQIQRYGNAGTTMIDVGAVGRWSARVHYGFAIKNITASTLGRCEEPLPQSLQCGISAQGPAALSFCLDVCKEARAPLEFRHGVEYAAGKYLLLRAGFTTASLRLAAGFGVRCPLVTLDYAVMTHPCLGLTQQFSLHFSRH